MEAGPKGRTAVVCEGCENIYVVKISTDGDSEPVGIPSECRGCGGSSFTILGKDRKELQEQSDEG